MEKRTIMNDFFKVLTKFNFPKNIIGEYSPLALAFIGDSVFKVYVRTYILSQGNMTPNKLHILGTKFERASAQAKILHEISGMLTEEELEVSKRGRNAKSGTIPKNADLIDYKNATGLESLFGYLYLTGQNERLCELLEQSIKIIDTLK